MKLQIIANGRKTVEDKKTQCGGEIGKSSTRLSRSCRAHRAKIRDQAQWALAMRQRVPYNHPVIIVFVFLYKEMERE